MLKAPGLSLLLGNNATPLGARLATTTPCSGDDANLGNNATPLGNDATLSDHAMLGNNTATLGDNARLGNDTALSNDTALDVDANPLGIAAKRCNNRLGKDA